MASWVWRLVRWVGAAAFVMVIVAPVLALSVRSAASWDGSSAGEIAYSGRVIGLTLKTIGLAAAGCIATLVLSIPGAIAVGRMERDRRNFLLPAVMIGLLCLPPMVLTFGWQRVWGRQLSGTSSAWYWVRCVWIWASWLWPVAAMVIGAGWSRVGRSAYEAAIMETGPMRAFVKGVLPVLGGFVGSAALIVFAVLLGEYSVPHANGVSVVATESLVLADAGDMAGIVRLSLPVMVVVIGALLLANMFWRGSDPGGSLGAAAGGRSASNWYAWCVLILAAIVPIVTLGWREALPAAMMEAVQTYGRELFTAAVICFGAGAMALVAGMFAVSLRRGRMVACVLMLTLGLAPGAIVGEGILAAYRPSDWMQGWLLIEGALGWVYDGWAIVVLGLAGRYAWIGMLCAWAAVRGDGRMLDEQASVDGAGWGVQLGMRWMRHWPVMACGMCMAGVLAFSDVAVGSLVETPSTPMVGKILIEKYHRFETGMLVALSLLCVLATVPVAVLAGLWTRRSVS